MLGDKEAPENGNQGRRFNVASWLLPLWKIFYNGKSHLGVALALKACQAGMSIYFPNMEDLIKKDHDAGRAGAGRSYYKSALVIVDEVG